MKLSNRAKSDITNLAVSYSNYVRLSTRVYSETVTKDDIKDTLLWIKMLVEDEDTLGVNIQPRHAVEYTRRMCLELLEQFELKESGVINA